MPTESLGERLNGKLHRLFVVLIFAWVVLNGFTPVMNQVDLGFQVAQGRWMVDHIAPYSHDVFNYPNLGHPIIDEYPLFDLVLYSAWSLGWWGPCLLATLACVTLVAVLLRGAKALRLPDSTAVAIAIGLMLLFLLVSAPPSRRGKLDRLLADGAAASCVDQLPQRFRPRPGHGGAFRG